MTEWDPKAQATVLLENLARLETVIDGTRLDGAELRASIDSMKRTAGQAMQLGDGDVAAHPSMVETLRADLYECITTTEEMAGDFAMVLDRVPGMRDRPAD